VKRWIRSFKVHFVGWKGKTLAFNHSSTLPGIIITEYSILCGAVFSHNIVKGKVSVDVVD
jgi:hypothetical protein